MQNGRKTFHENKSEKKILQLLTEDIKKEMKEQILLKAISYLSLGKQILKFKEMFCQIVRCWFLW